MSTAVSGFASENKRVTLSQLESKGSGSNQNGRYVTRWCCKCHKLIHNDTVVAKKGACKVHVDTGGYFHRQRVKEGVEEKRNGMVVEELQRK